MDDGELLEVSPRWARNMVTAFCRASTGAPVGVIANQPWYLGGVIDADAAQKAARFVRTCNAFGLPLVVLVDTPGFLPGTKQEGLGVIRHGAKLLHAFAEAVVPKVTVVLRKAYGGAFIYDELEGPRRRPRARLAGAPRSGSWARSRRSGIVHRRAIAAADDPEGERDRLGGRVRRGSRVGRGRGGSEGFIDELVEPPARRAAVWRVRWRRCRALVSTATAEGTSRCDPYVALGDSFTAGLEPGAAALAGRAGAGARRRAT